MEMFPQIEEAGVALFPAAGKHQWKVCRMAGEVEQTKNVLELLVLLGHQPCSDEMMDKRLTIVFTHVREPLSCQQTHVLRGFIIVKREYLLHACEGFQST